MSKANTRPCRHPKTARRYMKDTLATFTCVKCSKRLLASEYPLEKVPLPYNHWAYGSGPDTLAGDDDL